jgi:hypothetical protein
MRYLPRTKDGEIRKVEKYRIVAVFERNGARLIDGTYKKNTFEIQRDKWGKFSVVVDGRKTQSNLSAEGIVGYMANMLLQGHKVVSLEQIIKEHDL